MIASRAGATGLPPRPRAAPLSRIVNAGFAVVLLFLDGLLGMVKR